MNERVQSWTAWLLAGVVLLSLMPGAAANGWQRNAVENGETEPADSFTTPDRRDGGARVALSLAYVPERREVAVSGAHTEEMSGVLLLACYDGEGRLLDSETAPLTALESGAVWRHTAAEEAEIVRAFAWDETVLTPLCGAETLTLGAAKYEALAHWVFSDEEGYTSGSLADSSLKISDRTGRGNDLLLMSQKIAAGQNAGDSLSFGDNVLRGGGGPLGTSPRSLKFSPMSNQGAYFVTASGELDDEEFMEGYTFEIIFSARDSGQWAAMLGKRGTPNSAYDIRTDWHNELDGSSQGSFNTGGSNDYTNAGVTGDLQLTFNNTHVKTHDPRILNNNYQSCFWSDPYGVTRDRLHYAVIRNDGDTTVLYIDGLPVLRSDNHNRPQPGIDKLDGLGWAVGANYGYLKGTYFNGANWNQTTSNLLTQEEFLALEAAGSLGAPQFRGEIQEIRLTKGFRPDSFLLIPNNEGLVPDAVYTDQLGHNGDVSFLSKPENYNFVFIPDTQYYVQYKRGADGGSLIMSTMFEWIGAHRAKYNIFGASHVGDVTENNSSPRGDIEWAAASKSFEILDKARVPYTVLPGNHDWRPNFLTTFPESRNKGKGYEFATSSTPIVDPANDTTRVGGGYSSYMIVRGGSYNYLVLATGGPNSGSSNIGSTLGAQGSELNWCLAVLRTYRDLPTILLEHTSGNTVINNLINPFPQVFMHVWGHLSGSYAQWVEPGESSANPGYWNIQIDYQSDVYGGNGWLDMFEFDESAGAITMHTFSPWVEKKLVESAADSDWWRSLPRQDRVIHPFDVKNLTRYFKDASALTGYKNTISGGSGLPTGNKPGGRQDGVLALDFDTRFEGLRKAALGVG
ncbi:MAG: hypothetical protein LBK75_07190 [Oscillospiraceae bacterium]|jgi:hypothetical protein|nr:hypothetical protein [Oscillospiraceae bacterium]